MSIESIDIQTVESLNRWDPETFCQEMSRCCGSYRWVQEMMKRRPFQSRDDLFKAADETWIWLFEEDWLEAFSHHPKIGDIGQLREKFASTQVWAQQEQGSLSQASEEILTALAQGNQEYLEKFGYIFIVCATGKTAAEMLAILQERLQHSPDAELQIAALEQQKITRIRLEKLLS